ncbi:YHYH domain-containing protein [Haliea sp. E17]|uniref:YHYH domain-containing protein n=1 Tax=Haliea sp. E17 TaxID=3401576 RepID=UPI003AB08373
MKKTLFTVLLTVVASGVAFGVAIEDHNHDDPTVNSHGGGLDSRGGHNCSAKSKEKGLCTGYHYHR